MAFKFRFETLQRVRKIREDMAQQEFSKVQIHLQRLEHVRESRINQKVSSGKDLMARMKRGIHADDVRAYDNFATYLDNVIEQLEMQIVQARKMLEQKRMELLKAKREYKAMERLREIDLERYRAEESRKEMNFINEIAIQRHGSRP